MFGKKYVSLFFLNIYPFEIHGLLNSYFEAEYYLEHFDLRSQILDK